MRGYFGVGVEGLSKPRNLGALMRTAHAFGASFFFSIEADARLSDTRSADTSDAAGALPYHAFHRCEDFRLPVDCDLVGIELTDDAIPLPSFRHPTRAAYVLGSERGSLSPRLVALCRFVVKIPTRFCVNVGLAGAIVMYDRSLSLGRHAERPVAPGGPKEVAAPPLHKWGAPILRGRKKGEKPFLPE
jgi:tRNA G18 (ribose-2'-O)-methylase SpoU